MKYNHVEVSPRKRSSQAASGRPRHTPLLDLSVGSRKRLWTRAAYERATSLGMFEPEERLELIEGELIEKKPQNSPHATATNLAHEALRAIMQPGFAFRIQQPLSIGEFSQPEPDIAVVKGSARDFEEAHPATAVLVVEVSDTTVAYDRLKSGLYARAGVKEYWLLNIPDRLLEVHRDPARMADEPYGWNYRSVSRHGDLENVSPLFGGGRSVAIIDLPPRRKTTS